MKPYKTCNGCKALTLLGKNLNGFSLDVYYCSLGYKMDGIKKAPIGFCTKPKTNSALLIEKK